jgi:hypothetical protein
LIAELLRPQLSSSAKAGDPVRRGFSVENERLWNTGSPPQCAIAHKAGDDSERVEMIRPYAAGTGSAVTDLIFSIAKREVTFFSGTALINFL